MGMRGKFMYTAMAQVIENFVNILCSVTVNYG